MWIGTFGGLSKFDGYKFTNYVNDPDDRFSLISNNITSLFEDTLKQRLWIATENGACYLDQITGRFIIPFPAGLERNGLAEERVTQFCMDDHRHLYIGTGAGVCIYDEVTHQMDTLHVNAAETKKISQNYVLTLYNENNQYLWIGTQSGLDVWDIVKQKTYRNVGGLSSAVWAISPGSNNAVYVGMLNSGIYKKEKGEEPEKWVFKKIMDINGRVQSIAENEEGHLWYCVLESGLFLYNPETRTSRQFVHDVYNETSLSTNHMRVFYQDDLYNLWAGSFSFGFDFYDYNKKAFGLIKKGSGPYDLFNSAIRALCVDEDDNVWVGTKIEGGISCLNRSTNTFFNYRKNTTHQRGLNDDFVFALESYKNYILAGTLRGGLNVLNRKTGKFRYYTADVNRLNTLSINHIRDILVDSQNRIWIGTVSAGVDLFNPETGHFTNFLYTDQMQFIRQVYEDRAGVLWVGDRWFGLVKFDPENRDCINYRHDPANPFSISNNRVNCIYEDHQGRMWIGTEEMGINYFDRDTERFIAYTVDDGLPNNTIWGILEDENGNLWISTNKGISRFSPPADPLQSKGQAVFKNYSRSDGLQGDEFAENAYCKTRDGYLLFGGGFGLNMFRPEAIEVNPIPPEVQITGLKILNQDVPVDPEGTEERTILSRSISLTREIVFSYKDRAITFEFTAINFSNPESNQYAYMLEGFDETWNYVGNQRTANYTNLSPGEYTFHVKAGNSDNVWNEHGATIHLVITPPFWATSWFRIILFIVIAGLIFSIFELRVYQIRRQREKLEIQVEMRTEELRKANRALKRANENLEFANNEVSAQKDELLKQKDALIKATIELKRSNESLTEFAYVASHDLQEPVRKVIAFGDRLLAKYNETLDEKGIDYLKRMQNASMRMQELISGLLTYSRVTTKGKPFESVNLNDIVKHVLNDLEIRIEKTHAQVEVNELPMVQADPLQMRQLFQNLIGNALKFFKPDVAPVVRVYATNGEVDRCKVHIEDNGIGFDKTHADRIFGVFQRLHGKDDYEGTGIGLSVCKKIVERHGGEIKAIGHPGKGAEFVVAFPKEKR